MVDDAAAWIDHEPAGCRLADERLGRRRRALLDRMAGAMGESIPFACRDWASTKAAYRFFANGRVSAEEILGGPFQATCDRFAGSGGPIMVLHGTSELSYRRRPERVGQTCRVDSGKDEQGRYRRHTVRGLPMHAGLAVTTEGLPPGLAAVKFRTRRTFEGTAAPKRRIDPTRVPIGRKESVRWPDDMRRSTAPVGDAGRCVHVGDRESGVYELFCLARELGTHFPVGSCVDRLAGDGTRTVRSVLDEVPVQGRHAIAVRDRHGRLEETMVEPPCRRLRILPPIGKPKRYPALSLTVPHAREPDEPPDRPCIDWKLVTDLPVTSNRSAIEKLRWYASRWKIELFHEISKSGCKAEDAGPRTAGRLVKLIAVMCIPSRRVFRMTMPNRSAPGAEPGSVSTGHEITLLDPLVPDAPSRLPRGRTLALYLTKIARLGGHLARARDPPPGNIVMWRGMSRLTDITLAASLHSELVGNWKPVRAAFPR